MYERLQHIDIVVVRNCTTKELFKSTLKTHTRTHTLIALIVESASTSDPSVKVCQTTWRHIPEDSSLHTRCPENLQFHRTGVPLETDF